MMQTPRKLLDCCHDVMTCRLIDARGFAVFIAAILASGFIAVAEEEFDREHVYSLGVGFMFSETEKQSADTRWQYIQEHNDSTDERERLASALLAIGMNEAKVQPILRQLLNDKDIAVRRTAAEALLKDKSRDSDNAKAFTYAEAVEAELKVQSICKDILNQNFKEQFASARALIALGRSALWALRQRYRDANPAIQLSAIFAAQEIEAATGGIEPVWADEVRKKLKEKITFEFKNERLEKALESLSKESGATIRLRDGLAEKLKDSMPIVSLRVADLEAESTLKLLLKLCDGNFEYCLRKGAVEVVPPGNLATSAWVHFMDVRDLEAEGYHAGTWELLFRRDVPALLISALSDCHATHGFLILSLEGDRKWAQPANEYLNSVRKTANLPIVEWSIGVKAEK